MPCTKAKVTGTRIDAGKNYPRKCRHEQNLSKSDIERQFSYTFRDNLKINENLSIVVYNYLYRLCYQNITKICLPQTFFSDSEKL